MELIWRHILKPTCFYCTMVPSLKRLKKFGMLLASNNVCLDQDHLFNVLMIVSKMAYRPEHRRSPTYFEPCLPNRIIMTRFFPRPRQDAPWSKTFECAKRLDNIDILLVLDSSGETNFRNFPMIPEYSDTRHARYTDDS